MAGVNNLQQVFHPQSFGELDDVLDGISGKVVYIAGATDLMVRQDAWRESNIFIDLSGLTELTQTIAFDTEKVTVGAGVPMRVLINHRKLAARFPMLIEACRQIGSVQIQNRATLGGNIANASPAGDALPVLAVYNSLLMVGPRQEEVFQSKALDEVMIGPGQTSLEGNRYIAAIVLPLPAEKGQFWYFRKVGPRHAMAISKVSLAVSGQKLEDTLTDIRIAAGSVTPRIQRARATEKLLCGKTLTDRLIKTAGEKIQTEIDPITDIRSTREYRQNTCRALLVEALTQIMRR